MLEYDELKKIGEFKKLSINNAEKDYLQEVVLYILYDKIIGKNLVFKGGTCLYKIYNLNRFSEDLDFTAIGKIAIEKINSKMKYNLNLLGITCRLKEIKKFKNEINIRFLLHGPLYKGKLAEECFIPLDISLRERVVLMPNRTNIISLYKEIPMFYVSAMDENEILSEKIRTILTRNKARDIYDLWFLLKKGAVPKLNLINKKLKIYDLKFSPEGLIKKINEGHKMWASDLKNLIIGELPNFNAIKDDIEKCFETA